MKDIIFITFDIPRSEYPPISYSVAAMFAAIQSNGFKPSHFPIDIKQILQDRKETSGYIGYKKMSYNELIKEQNLNQDISSAVKEKLKSNLNYFVKFRYIAISITRWSIEYCNILIELLQNYTGKTILGGYEITAIRDDLLLKEFPKANYFIKGYAEKALIKLLKNEILEEKKIIREKISEADLYSPYLTGILGLYFRKIYWESKRGCNFRCGFCEWGAFEDKILVHIKLERLKKEIDLIGKSNVEEINILDGTFNFGTYYIEILNYILQTTELKVTFQARFEMLFGKKADEFLKLCSLYKDRIHMEFGLQTIHNDEMLIIGRDNKMDKIKSALEKLNNYGINYETSIIYAIPCQTVEKMIDTIEYLLINNCKKICAYPLQIAKNSNLEQQKSGLKVTETQDNLKVSSINSSYSFTTENKKDMDLLAKRLHSNDLNGIKKIQPNLKLELKTEYQYELISTDEIENKEYLMYLIDKYYEEPTSSDIEDIDSVQGIVHLGSKFSKPVQTEALYIKELNSCKKFYEIEKSKPNEFEINGNKIKMKTSDKNIKFFCKIRLGKSGNFYVFRDIVYED